MVEFEVRLIRKSFFKVRIIERVLIDKIIKDKKNFGVNLKIEIGRKMSSKSKLKTRTPKKAVNYKMLKLGSLVLVK